jgi:succinate dehydrogenase / fumarate reductase, membrane anchor subunit
LRFGLELKLMADDQTSMRTPYGRIQHLGSARSGTHHAWMMRVTSMALIPLTIAFVWLLLSLVGKSHADVLTILRRPFPAIAMLLFVGTGIYHMMLGMQVIIEDYVHGEHTKHWALMANTFFSICVGLACIFAVLRISFS